MAVLSDGKLGAMNQSSDCSCDDVFHVIFQEAEFEKLIHTLASKLAPLCETAVPDAYNNMVGDSGPPVVGKE